MMRIFASDAKSLAFTESPILLVFFFLLSAIGVLIVLFASPATSEVQRIVRLWALLPAIMLSIFVWIRLGTWANLLALLAITFLMPPAPTTIGLLEVGFGIILILTALGWLVQMIRRKSQPIASLNRQAIPLFGLVCLLSLPLTMMNGGTWASWLRATLPFLVLIVSFLAIASAIHGPRDLIRLVHMLIGVGLLFAGKTVFLFVSYRLWEFNALGAYSRVTYLDPATTVPAPLVGAILALGMSLFSQKWWLRALYSGMFGVMSAAIMMTLSRGMILGLAIGIIALACGLWWANARRELRQLMQWSLLGWLVLITVVIRLNFTATIVARLNDISTNDAVRIAEYSAATEQFLGSPLLGKGLGTGFFVPLYTVLELDPNINSIHNLLFYFAAKTGLIGGGLVLLWLIFATRDLLFVFRDRRANDSWRHVCLVAAASVGLLTYAMTFAVYRLFYYNIALAILLAVLSQARWFSAPQRVFASR